MKCKKGGLAFIKKSIRPKNVGLIVTCDEYLGYYIQGETVEISGEVFLAIDTGHFWKIGSSTGSIETQYGKSKMAFIPDSWLTPIDAEPKEDDFFNEELEDDYAQSL